MDADAGCQMHGRKHRKPTGDEFFVESEGLTRKANEWIENRAPSNLIAVERVVKMLCADGVFGEQHGALARIPDGQCPITDEFGEAIDAPFFMGHSDDGNVSGVDSQRIGQFADEVSAIVQATVPRESRTGLANVWLHFATRFLCGVKRAIEDTYATLRIGFIAIGTIRSESRAELFDVLLGRRLFFEIPSSKLDAHIFCLYTESFHLSFTSIDPRLRTFPARTACR